MSLLTDTPTADVVLEADLRRFCATSKPGTALLPERRLAARYGMTHAGARRVLTRLLHDGLIHRHQGRGTFVAEHSSENACQTILQVDTWHELTHPYYAARLRGIMAESRGHRFRFQVFDGPPVQTAEFYSEVSRDDVAGVIVPYATRELEDELRRAHPGVAILSTGYPTVDTTITHVAVDYPSLGALAAMHLVGRGARRPVAVCGHRDAQTAFAAACADAGVAGTTIQVDPRADAPLDADGRRRVVAADGLAFDDEVVAARVLATVGRPRVPMITQVTRGAPSPDTNAALLEVDGLVMGRLIVQTLAAMVRQGLYLNTTVRVRPTLVAGDLPRRAGGAGKETRR
jgi:hypothetical protein